LAGVLLGTRDDVDAETRHQNDSRLADRDACAHSPHQRQGATRHGRSESPTGASDPHITALKLGLKFNKDVPYSTWSALGEKLAGRKNSLCWWLGDWLVFGERNYLRYRDAIDATGLDYQTLRNYAAVARRFPLSRRRDTLSFQHHAAVAALGPAVQDHWLDLAAANHWSLHALRDHLRGVQSDPDADSHRVLRFQVDVTCEQHWRAAAARSGASFQEWIIRALDAAARADSDLRSRSGSLP
jgi:hypothetical protein